MKTNRDERGRFKRNRKVIKQTDLSRLKANPIIQKIIDSGPGINDVNIGSTEALLNAAAEIRQKELEEKYITNGFSFDNLFKNCKSIYELSRNKTNAHDDFSKLLRKDSLNENDFNDLHNKFCKKINKVYEDRLLELINSSNLKISRGKAAILLKPFTQQTSDNSPPLISKTINGENLDVLVKKLDVIGRKNKPNIKDQFETLENAIASATKKYWQAKRELMIINKILEKTYSDGAELSDNDKELLSLFLNDVPNKKLEQTND